MTRPSPVPDIRLRESFTPPFYSVGIDWVLRDDGTLDDTQALAAGVIVALGTNSLADLSDQLPDPDSTDRCGWWGDLDADTIWNAWPIGCKLWLMRRSAIVPVQARYGATVAHVQNYIHMALQPFIDLGIASRIDVDAVRTDRQRVDATIRIFKGPRPTIQLVYSILWDELQYASSQST
ncbi:MAG TPA: phage GP46 family protein [Xanthobacteraceae bacterium]|jgi:phage gp46-like protein